ncbi:hypothetical protein EIP86_005152 [Pleurotus ostreatoroseus]|nr:hypothetical protein EIP86_005152 [Pleurotus ostreatoroseus]
MHHCLTIEEILRIVFVFAEYFPRVPRAGRSANRELSREYQIDLRTLFYLALTCKRFQSLALDRLWRKQWGLENLIALLPKGQMRLKNATDADWARFDAYARRVKKLSVHNDENCIMIPPSLPSCAVMETLSARPKPILPSLKDFTWASTAVSAELLGYFDIFLGPSVTNFLLVTDQELFPGVGPLEVPDDNVESLGMADDDVESMEISDDDDDLVELLISKAEMKLANLSSMSPMLEDFHFGTQGTPQLVLQLPQIVSSLSKLRYFYCTVINLPFPFELLSALSVHPSLEFLELYVDSQDDQYPIIEQDVSVTVAIQATFSTLQYLVLGGASPFFCAEALKGIKFSALKSIKLQVDEATGLRDALVAVNTSCSPRAFRELKVVEFPGGDPSGDGIVVTGNDLWILRKFKFLTSLVIYCPFDLTDHDLRNIATWWPRLQTLSMGKYGWRIAHRVTLVGLLELVKGCPRISELDVAFNPMQPAGVVPQGHRNKRLTTLGVCDSPVEGDPQDIANRLKALFPRLGTIRASPGGYGDWPQVELGL